ncbi:MULTISPECIES: TetR/AcrR family transcriptional regulator [unclassified Pseudonocardia]|uniref:TetR/AcrR family transcriptional regulator n=1 Tax=unclassified Pseudonocardia TaxID=2619320 RepID=UPI0001FFF0D0|nr:MULTISPECIES: TetR/AcrR family transcriptional regulator [unclassified Pseudonocardia]ALE72643.1 transcriptional regulator [Pseudonocardia sp. EC080625-04]ALL75958.1 transcriptional regulator [Pseudonocardia sp. EC080610-09]ALL82986.1 transcriptional regulator [Pseudonocardia sp. EC080619-01]OLM19884.1 Transcriptional regulator, TetR family [Pseudonocardia sp. Ae707_Ps1]
MPDTLTPTTDAGRRLLAAASELFYRRGITAVGVAGIAEAAGVTKKTLYDCYGSKSTLVAAYLAHRHRTWWEHLQRRIEAAPAPRVLAVFEAYREHPALDSDVGCAFQRGAAELDEGHPGRAVITEHKTAVRAEIARLLAEDVPGDATELADLLALLLEGAAFQRGLDGTPDALDRAAAHARALLAAR